MGGKIFGFPWKNLATCKLKRVGKKCAKEGAKMVFNSSNFLKKNLISKNQEYSPARQCSFLITPTPPPHPSHPFWQVFCAGWVFWHGMGLSRCGHQRRPKAECSQRPCIFSWPMVISNSVNEFFVAV
jgi:hypothetical protein